MTAVVLVFLLFMLLFLILFGISLFTTLLIRVPYVPSHGRVVERMIALARIQPDDRVYDLGCGDGRVVHEVALRYGVPAFGYEISIIPYILGKIQGWLRKSPATLRLQDFFGQRLDRPTVIFTYLTPGVMARLETVLVRDGYTGVRVISHGFGFPNLSPVAIHHTDHQVTIYEYAL